MFNHSSQEGSGFDALVLLVEAEVVRLRRRCLWRGDGGESSQPDGDRARKVKKGISSNRLVFLWLGRDGPFGIYWNVVLSNLLERGMYKTQEYPLRNASPPVIDIVYADMLSTRFVFSV